MQVITVKETFKFEKNGRFEKDRRISNNFIKQLKPSLNRGQKFIFHLTEAFLAMQGNVGLTIVEEVISSVTMKK